MKKTNKNFGSALSREQMKNVTGGMDPNDGNYGSGKPTCTANCGSGSSVTCYGNGDSGCSAADGTGCSGNDSNGNGYFIHC